MHMHNTCIMHNAKVGRKINLQKKGGFRRRGEKKTDQERDEVPAMRLWRGERGEKKILQEKKIKNWD